MLLTLMDPRALDLPLLFLVSVNLDQTGLPTLNLCFPLDKIDIILGVLGSF